MKEKIFNFIFICLIILLAFSIFIVFSKVCFKIYFKFSFADTYWEPGAILHLNSSNPYRYSSKSKIKNIAKKIAYKYTNLLIPEVKYLPLKINHPLYQVLPVENKEAYNKKVDIIEARPIMIFTQGVIYAPIHGKSYSSFHNIQQFRYPYDLKKEKNKNEIRIFITGGSTAWGYGAPDDNSTISSFLEKFLNEKFKNYSIKVINAGVDGYDTTYERIWIFNRITEYNPDIIISYSGYNDIRYTYLIGRDLFSNIHNDGSYFFWAIQQYECFNRGKDLADRIQQYDFPKLFFDKNDFPYKTLKNVTIISLYLNYVGIKYVFILQPINREKTLPEVIPLAKKLEANLEELSKNLKFIFISHMDLFYGKENLFRDDCHLGDIGNQIIAQRLVKDLEPVILEVIRKREKSEK